MALPCGVGLDHRQARGKLAAWSGLMPSIRSKPILNSGEIIVECLELRP
jgi:hypothetical protein